MTDDRRTSLCRVTNAAGQIIAMIDPLSRKRTNVNGAAATILSPQGWALNTQRYIAWPGHAGHPKPVIEPMERNRYGKIRNRDGRVGQGHGRGRPRKARAG